MRRMLTTFLEEMRYHQEQGAIRQLREAVASVIDKVELDGSAEARNITIGSRCRAKAEYLWRPQRDSNPRTYRERVVS